MMRNIIEFLMCSKVFLKIVPTSVIQMLVIQAIMTSENILEFIEKSGQ